MRNMIYIYIYTYIPSADVECPGLYHCQGSYCVPPEKVCDQRIDCPERDDEIDCGNYVCPGKEIIYV